MEQRRDINLSLQKNELTKEVIYTKCFHGYDSKMKEEMKLPIYQLIGPELFIKQRLVIMLVLFSPCLVSLLAVLQSKHILILFFAKMQKMDIKEGRKRINFSLKDIMDFILQK